MPIPAETPVKLVVQVRGRAEFYQSSRAGIYTLQSTDINGKEHWLAENGKRAIWYLAEGQSKSARWMIGQKRDLGKNVGGIASDDDTATPSEAINWEYYSNDEWMKSDSKDLVIVTRFDGKN